MALFDYDSLLAGATYRGSYIRDGKDPEHHVGLFGGISADQMLKIIQNPDGKCRQVALLCNDQKYGRAFRFFEPETLVLVDEDVNV
jgi:hypothetical protein